VATESSNQVRTDPDAADGRWSAGESRRCTRPLWRAAGGGEGERVDAAAGLYTWNGRADAKGPRAVHDAPAPRPFPGVTVVPPAGDGIQALGNGLGGGSCAQLMKARGGRGQD